MSFATKPFPVRHATGIVTPRMHGARSGDPLGFGMVSCRPGRAAH
jgi:hypothetical protein